MENNSLLCRTDFHFIKYESMVNSSIDKFKMDCPKFFEFYVKAFGLIKRAFNNCDTINLDERTFTKLKKIKEIISETEDLYSDNNNNYPSEILKIAVKKTFKLMENMTCYRLKNLEMCVNFSLSPEKIIEDREDSSVELDINLYKAFAELEIKNDAVLRLLQESSPQTEKNT